jgi:hypothetical protein
MGTNTLAYYYEELFTAPGFIMRATICDFLSYYGFALGDRVGMVFTKLLELILRL